jgi:two-component system nitrogen regulation response regulator NtrX
MKALRQQIQLMAPTNGRVLIFGESGTGKELAAHAIHAQSQRKDEMFVEVNCAAIPEDLIESELFGHTKGAFASATSDKEGKFQRANGGTLFLDEVGDMSLKTQSKVLRTLDEQRFTPVGSGEATTVDVRVIASTNKDLEEEISKGNFREDLFYRLNVIPFFVPPLRERQEDVPMLARHFLKEFSAAYGRRPREITDSAIETLMRYSWPGNVRELQNAMEYAVVLARNEKISVKELPAEVQLPAALQQADRNANGGVQNLDDMERNAIIQALAQCHGNKKKAAQVLGIQRPTLYNKMKRYAIEL